VKHGEELPWAKLTEEMVIDARCWAAEQVLTTAEIISRLGVNVSGPAMTQAINGQTWKHLNESFPPPQRRPHGRVKGRPQGKLAKPRSGRGLTAEQVRGIRTAQTSMQKTATQYGVSKTLVNEIIHRRQYADVTDQEES
jgi:hypothetical protein